MKKPGKYKSILKKIGILLLAAFIGLVAIVIVVLAFQDQYAEQKFSKEASTIPGIKTKIISVFEGGVSAQIEIPEKGTVDVLYGIQGLEYVLKIRDFDTRFMCPEDATVGAFLNLRKKSNFKKWFPFQVNNLQQLINHYDDITAILETFPHSPDPNYTIITSSRPFRKNDMICSIYFKK
ncbi:hypothetical protein KBD69_00970 [Candidatus Woesebacteria bacterium]|nr:hypothetical protein [Candidatus Woesebacteria bacterium]